MHFDADEGGDGRYPIAIIISASEFCRHSWSCVSIHGTIWLTSNWPAVTILYHTSESSENYLINIGLACSDPCCDYSLSCVGINQNFWFGILSVVTLSQENYLINIDLACCNYSLSCVVINRNYLINIDLACSEQLYRVSGSLANYLINIIMSWS